VTEPWWKSAVVYQIYPRSFADTDGDGVGDLEGIRHRLDHLAWLGVDALWLSPVYRSPMADFGYDISDFCAIDPLFGSLDDFDHLLADAHSLGMKLILDWVPNHTSDQHPWFVDSRSARDSPKRDWYVWRDQLPGGKPPNNWVASFAPEPTWTHDPATDQSYLHLFLPGQPDLNWGNPEVEAAMHDVLRFWLDRGVDGFRADVVHCIGKDPSLPDDPPEVAGLPHSVLLDEPLTHDLLRRIRALLDGYPGERMMVGEVYLLDIDRMATYYGAGAGDELNLSFNFLPVHSPWDAGIWRDHLARTEQALAPRGGWPTWVLSNHDVPRHRTRYSGWPNEPADATRSEARARAAAVLLLTARGTPFLYQGEELGLLDADVPPDRVVDPGGRDGCRAPIPWSADERHGWGAPGDAEPWLPFPPEADTRNVATERADASSILHLYRRLLAVRRGSEALRLGNEELLDAPASVIAFRRTAGDEVCTVLINTSGDAQEVALDVPHRVVVSSDDRHAEPVAYAGVVGPDQALVLRPA
jgi:alpha-glucosidase